jgi:uncharacterized MAPEG superfamily protein
MLVWSAVLCLSIPSAGVASVPLSAGGFAWALGNRDTPNELPVWGQRAQRAHANMVENLAPFAALVLVAHVTGNANYTTAVGATLFFWARVAHAVVYTAGIPYVRTLAYGVGLVGEIMILGQLF